MNVIEGNLIVNEPGSVVDLRGMRVRGRIKIQAPNVSIIGGIIEGAPTARSVYAGQRPGIVLENCSLGKTELDRLIEVGSSTNVVFRNCRLSGDLAGRP